MKKLLFLPLFGVIILSACQTSNQNTANIGSAPASRDFRRPDFGQPEEAPDMRGLVKSVMGNEATVLKIERPQFNRNDANGQNQTGDNGSQGGSAQNQERRTAFGSTGTGGNTRMPGMGRGFRPDSEVSDQTREQMLERVKEMSSGEETVLIPVGIRMLKPDTSDAASSKPQMVEASLEDVKADKMILVWLDKTVTDRKVAEFVLITQ